MILLAGIASATDSKFATAVPPRFGFLDDLLGRSRAIAARTVGADAGIVDDNLGAFSGAEQRNATADAAARAGDDNDLAVE